MSNERFIFGTVSVFNLMLVYALENFCMYWVHLYSQVYLYIFFLLLTSIHEKRTECEVVSVCKKRNRRPKRLVNFLRRLRLSLFLFLSLLLTIYSWVTFTNRFYAYISIVAYQKWLSSECKWWRFKNYRNHNSRERERERERKRDRHAITHITRVDLFVSCSIRAIFSTIVRDFYQFFAFTFSYYFHNYSSKC